MPLLEGAAAIGQIIRRILPLRIPVFRFTTRPFGPAPSDLPRALLLLDKVREEGLEPVITYGSLVTACERVGSVDDLSKVFSS
jgi:hypothetical protein